MCRFDLLLVLFFEILPANQDHNSNPEGSSAVVIVACHAMVIFLFSFYGPILSFPS